MSFHPELRRAARWLPRFTFTPRLTRLLQGVQKWRGTPKPPVVEGVRIRDVFIPSESGGAVRVRLYWPQVAPGPLPAMLWVHGGGFIIGSPEQDEARNIALCRDLGIAIAAVAYRLAPNHPYPGPMGDAYSALQWLSRQEDVARDRIAVGGASAGGGLAAGLVLMACDRGEVPVAFQMLVYPMLDDRTVLRTDIDPSTLRMWNNVSNRFGWTSYLGEAPGGEVAPTYAAPARREDLSELPPTWIGVGTRDLFHDEDVAYARRLEAAGVPCVLKVVPGAFHAFDLVCPDTAVTRDFVESYRAALSEGLKLTPLPKREGPRKT